jgi:hypothetical protein
MIIYHERGKMRQGHPKFYSSAHTLYRNTGGSQLLTSVEVAWLLLLDATFPSSHFPPMHEYSLLLTMLFSRKKCESRIVPLIYYRSWEKQPALNIRKKVKDELKNTV